MIDTLNITLSGPTGSGKSLIGGIIAKVLHERGADVEVLLDGCPAPDSGIDLSGFTVVMREAPAPKSGAFEVTGPPVSEMSAEIRSRLRFMGVPLANLKGVQIHHRSGLIEAHYRPLYRRDYETRHETAEEYATWKSAESKAKLEAGDTTGLTVTIAGPAGARKTRFGEYLLRALSDYGSTLGKTQDVVEQNIRRFRDADETDSPAYVGQFEGSPLRIGTHGGDGRRSPNRQDLTIRELQTALPWTVRYSADFRANPQSHKDFAHALLHIQKASGALAAFVDDMDHRRETADEADTQERYGKYLADMVVCALRLANTFPGGVLDLQRAVEDRLESKNTVTLPRPAA